MQYRPRTASKKWLNEDCPSEVLAIHDDGGKFADRYTLFYKTVTTDHFGNSWLGGRSMNSQPMHPQGIGMYFEMRAHEVAAFRDRERRTRCRWSDLPSEVQKCVLFDCENL
jgi:hypothetical protein